MAARTETRTGARTTTATRPGRGKTPPVARAGRKAAPAARSTAQAAGPTVRTRGRTSTASTDNARSGRPVVHALVAAEQAVRRNSLEMRVPILGELHLPPTEDMVFIGGVAVLAVVGLLEWPVAVLLGVGHGLATNRHNKMLRAFGEALEAA
ncbi:MAG TPA: hypothetical protein VGJ63_20915 [Micromonosporaceae bacterium]